MVVYLCLKTLLIISCPNAPKVKKIKIDVFGDIWRDPFEGLQVENI